MKRSDFLRRLALLGVGVAGLDGFLKAAMALPDEELPMPGLFVGHGSPNNILADNAYTRAMQGLGSTLPRPKAILVISAHALEEDRARGLAAGCTAYLTKPLDPRTLAAEVERVLGTAGPPSGPAGS